MDGAGRLARSRRPQPNRKATAIGAVAFLREQFGSHRVRARPPINDEPPHRLIVLIERHFPRRAGVVATVLLLLGSAGFGLVKGGHLEEFTSAVSDGRNALANSAGFRINTIAINGRKQLSQDEVLASGGV